MYLFETIITISITFFYFAFFLCLCNATQHPDQYMRKTSFVAIFPKRNNQCCKTMGDASSFWDFPKNGNRSGCFFSYVQGCTTLALPKSTKQPMPHFLLARRGQDVSPCCTTDTIQHFSFSHRQPKNNDC